jgi:hypothetical protein
MCVENGLVEPEVFSASYFYPETDGDSGNLVNPFMRVTF